MKAGLKNIKLIFAYADIVTIYKEDIEQLGISNISTIIKKISKDCIIKSEVANDVVIELNKNVQSYNANSFDDIITRCGEIVEIRVEWDDVTYDEYLAIADQKTLMSKDGNLYIVISDSKNIEDYFQTI